MALIVKDAVMSCTKSRFFFYDLAFTLVQSACFYGLNRLLFGLASIRVFTGLRPSLVLAQFGPSLHK